MWTYWPKRCSFFVSIRSMTLVSSVNIDKTVSYFHTQTTFNFYLKSKRTFLRIYQFIHGYSRMIPVKSLFLLTTFSLLLQMTRCLTCETEYSRMFFLLFRDARRSWTVRQFLIHWISLTKEQQNNARAQGRKRESDRIKGHFLNSTNTWQWPSCEPMVNEYLSYSLYKLTCISVNKLHNSAKCPS